MTKKVKPVKPAFRTTAAKFLNSANRLGMNATAPSLEENGAFSLKGDAAFVQANTRFDAGGVKPVIRFMRLPNGEMMELTSTGVRLVRMSILTNPFTGGILTCYKDGERMQYAAILVKVEKFYFIVDYRGETIGVFCRP